MKEKIEQEEIKGIVEKEIETPAGNAFTIRRMKVKDEDIITDRELARDGKNISGFLKSITRMSQEKYDKLLQGEIFYLLIQIRVLSKGSIYEAKVKSPYSGKLVDVNIDLSELPLQKLNKDKIGKSYDYDVELPYSKDKLKCRLLTGKDQVKIEYIRKNHSSEVMTYMLMLRTVSVNGEEVKDVNYFNELDSEDSEYLRQQMEEHDCGYETDLSVYDKETGSEFLVSIPFDETFFLGKTKPTKKGL